MNDRKSTSTNGHTISDFKDARLSSRDTKNNKDAHDRPAIFIENTKSQYNRSNKSN